MALVVDIAGPSRDPNELAIKLPDRGIELTGWQEIAVTLRAEAFPNLFQATLTTREADGKTFTVVAPGDACEVYLGENRVITGYVDRLNEAGSGETHQLQIVGRGKCQDLAECSAEWPSGQIAQATAVDIATKLAEPYGIFVSLANGASAGPEVPQFNLTYGETAGDIIQRVARNAHLLAYEDNLGTLILAALGDQQAASGIVYGGSDGNVEAWSVQRSMDQRFSEIVCTQAVQNVWGDLTGTDASFFFDKEVDPNVPRHRRLYLPLETGVADMPVREFTIRKAIWEVARRAGRSTLATATVDSWRDSNGKLWEPNTLVPTKLPGLPDDTLLCLSEVTFRKGEDGTHADLVLMPQEAFLPEPISLQPVNLSDIQRGGDVQ